jgi:hypothetical protein
VLLRQIAVIDKFAFDARQGVERGLKARIADGVLLEERMARRIEESAVEGGNTEGRTALVDDAEEFLEATP